MTPAAHVERLLRAAWAAAVLAQDAAPGDVETWLLEAAARAQVAVDLAREAYLRPRLTQEREGL